jgi:hypothetical protein
MASLHGRLLLLRDGTVARYLAGLSAKHLGNLYTPVMRSSE